MPRNDLGIIPEASAEVPEPKVPRQGLAPTSHVRYIVLGLTVGAYMITYIEFLVGLSLLIGFLVRPATLLGMFLLLNWMEPDVSRLVEALGQLAR